MKQYLIPVLFFGMVLQGVEISIHLSDDTCIVEKDFLVQNSATIKDYCDTFPEASDINIPFTIQQFDDWCRCCKIPHDRKNDLEEFLCRSTLDALVDMARASLFLNSPALLKKIIKNIISHLKISGKNCDELIQKLKENPDYLPSDLKNIIQQKLVIDNELGKILLKKFLLSFRQNYKSSDLELLRIQGYRFTCYCADLLEESGGTNCLVFYNEEENSLKLVDLKTGKECGTLCPLFEKVSRIDFNCATRTFACCNGSTVYRAQSKKDFTGSITIGGKVYSFNPSYHIQSFECKDTIDDGTVCASSAVCWHPYDTDCLALVEDRLSGWQTGRPEWTRHTTRITIINFRNRDYFSWRSKGWFQGSLAWSKNGNYLVVVKKKNSKKIRLKQENWLEIYDVSTLNSIPKIEPKKTKIVLPGGYHNVASIHSFVVGQQQLFIGENDYFEGTIFLLHMSDGQWFLTLLYGNSVSIKDSFITIDEHNNQLLLALDPVAGELYQADLSKIDDLYLDYIRRLYNVPLIDVLRLVNNPHDRQALSAISALEREYAFKRTCNDLIAYVKKFRIVRADGMKRFLSKKICYGVVSFASILLAGWMVYKAINNVSVSDYSNS